MPKALATIGPTYTCSVPCLFNSLVILLCVDCPCLCLQNCVPVWTALLATVSRTELFHPRKVCDTNVIVYFIWYELCRIIAMPCGVVVMNVHVHRLSPLSINLTFSCELRLFTSRENMYVRTYVSAASSHYAFL